MLAPALGLLVVMQQAAPAAGGAAASDAGARVTAEAEDFLPAALRFPLRARDGGELPSAAFERRLRRLAEQPLGKLHEVPVMLGDVIHACAAVQWDRWAVEALLAPWESRLDEMSFTALRELLQCGDLYAADWDPDSSSQRAGFHFGPSWELSAEDFRAHSGDEDVIQSANLVLADLQAYGEVARQWPAYMDFVGNSYESLEPVLEDHRLLRARDAVCGETLRTRVKCDLPFPFSGYAIDLRMVYRLEEDGALRGWFHGDSEDLHWYSGYDLFVPVRDSRGDLLGMLQLRQTGFDLDGVPEGRGDRRNGIRTVNGNLRLRAERRFAARGEREVFDRLGELPELPASVPLD